MRCIHFTGKLLAVIMAGDLQKFSSTRLASPCVRCTTESNPTGTGERAPGPQTWVLAGAASCLLPQCWLGMTPPHPGVPGGGAPSGGGTLQIFLSFTFPWPQPVSLIMCSSLSVHQVCSMLGQLVGFVYSSITLQTLPSQQGCPPHWHRSPNCFCLGGLGRLGSTLE